VSASDLEQLFAFQVKAAGLPEPEREYRAIKGRNGYYSKTERWTLTLHTLMAVVTTSGFMYSCIVMYG